MSEKISDYFIRPQRQTYYSYDLGSPLFSLPNRQLANRTDYFLQNRHNHKLTVSYFRLQDHPSHSTVLYLHTHHGSKLEGMYLVDPLLLDGFNVCLFDFAGYGNSEGDFVTMGVEEMWDIELVIQHLERSFGQKKFVLWGRSMGAVAALLYLQKIAIHGNHQVVSAVFDSPFHSLEKLTLQIGSKTSGLPEPLLKPFIFWLKHSLAGKINFKQLEILEGVQKISIPGIFITSKKDQFVNCSHSEILYNHYTGKKELHYIEQDHNQARKHIQLEKVFQFLRKTAQLTKTQNITKTILENNLQFLREHGQKLHQTKPTQLTFLN